MGKRINRIARWILYFPSYTRWGQRMNRWIDDRGWNRTGT
jgi:hypothetical protein